MFRTRLAVRRARRDGDAAQIDACNKVLDDRDLLAAVDEELHARHEASAGGTVTDFLSWLIDNLPAILAAVMAVVALFS